MPTTQMSDRIATIKAQPHPLVRDAAEKPCELSVLPKA